MESSARVRVGVVIGLFEDGTYLFEASDFTNTGATLLK